MARYLPLPLLLLWSLAAVAAGKQYIITVDRLACVYCAYDIEKKLGKIDGVKEIEVDFAKGLVTVNVGEGVELTESEMEQLFKDAGFTYRSMTQQLWDVAVFAAGTQYIIRVDGLACPYCAYGIEKKLKKIHGVEDIDVDLDKGLVTVNVRKSVELAEQQMVQLFKDTGFTYRSMTQQPLQTPSSHD